MSVLESTSFSTFILLCIASLPALHNLHTQSLSKTRYAHWPHAPHQNQNKRDAYCCFFWVDVLFGCLTSCVWFWARRGRGNVYYPTGVDEFRWWLFEILFSYIRSWREKVIKDRGDAIGNWNMKWQRERGTQLFASLYRRHGAGWVICWRIAAGGVLASIGN